MTAAQLEEIGVVCFGPNWQHSTAASLQITSRRIRYIMAGEQPITEKIETDLLIMLRQRIRQLESTINRLF